MFKKHVQNNGDFGIPLDGFFDVFNKSLYRNTFITGSKGTMTNDIYYRFISYANKNKIPLIIIDGEKSLSDLKDILNNVYNSSSLNIVDTINLNSSYHYNMIQQLNRNEFVDLLIRINCIYRGQVNTIDHEVQDYLNIILEIFKNTNTIHSFSNLLKATEYDQCLKLMNSKNSNLSNSQKLNYERLLQSNVSGAFKASQLLKFLRNLTNRVLKGRDNLKSFTEKGICVYFGFEKTQSLNESYTMLELILTDLESFMIKKSKQCMVILNNLSYRSEQYNRIIKILDYSASQKNIVCISTDFQKIKEENSNLVDKVNNFFVFNPNNHEAYKFYADMIGKEKRLKRNVGYAPSDNLLLRAIGTKKISNINESYEDEYIVHPNEIRSLSDNQLLFYKKDTNKYNFYNLV